ncbi:MAG: hypothetical protein FD174_1513 [Geobacteraceae bacterium]|nr:MAG: hypothetical protein FD174_1513 [Geobacteraceae bacterium]
MAEAKEVLEIMKEVAKSRIEMLKEGITLYDNEKKAFYLQEYEKKLRDIERLIRRLNLRLVHSRKDGQPEVSPD